METIEDRHYVFCEMLRTLEENSSVVRDLNNIFELMLLVGFRYCGASQTNMRKEFYEALGNQYPVETMVVHECSISEAIISLLFMTCVYENRKSWTGKLGEINVYGMYGDAISEILIAMNENGGTLYRMLTKKKYDTVIQLLEHVKETCEEAKVVVEEILGKIRGSNQVWDEVNFYKRG